MEFGLALKIIRKYHRFSRHQLASALVGWSVSDQMIVTYENGRVFPITKSLMAYADFLGVRLSSLIAFVESVASDEKSPAMCMRMQKILNWSHDVALMNSMKEKERERLSTVPKVSAAANR